MKQEEKIDYEKFRIKNKAFCIKCGNIAEYERYGYTWCKEHKDFLKEDPEELEKIVIKRLKELGI